MSLLKLKSWATESRLSRGGRYFVLYRYWTNFNLKRAKTDDFEVLPYDAEGYWWFETTIDPQYLEDMPPKNRIRFLYQMEGHYKK
jgi:hypothetical protein